jgi:hypothetical protein
MFVVLTSGEAWAQREQLESGGTVASVVPAPTHAIAVFSATAVDASGDGLLSWIRQIAALKPSAAWRGGSWSVA